MMCGGTPWRKEGITIVWDETTWAELDVAYCWNQWQPCTPMGKRAKQQARAFQPGEERLWQQVLREQEEIQAWIEGHPRYQSVIQACLEAMPDIEVQLEKLGSGETLGLTDWFHMKQFLWQFRQLNKTLREQGFSALSLLCPEEFAELEQYLAQLNPGPAWTPAFWIDDAYDDDLRMLRQQLRRLEIKEQERTEQNKRAIEQAYGIRRNRLGTWVVPRNTPLEEMLRKDGRVVCHVETLYDVTFGLREEADGALARLQAQVEAREKAVCVWLTQQFEPVQPSLRQWVRKLTHFDVQWARYQAGRKWGGVRPEWDADRFGLLGAFHPKIAEELAAEGEGVTPIDVEVRRGVTVITGPNMGGKTVALKTIGLIAVLAHYGLFVPARSCRLPLVGWIASMLGDQQSTKQGLSRFGAEVMRLTHWLGQEGAGLLLLDEIGRGTNPAEGTALAQAITKHLSSRSSWTVHVTHYHEVNQLSGIRRYQVAGLCWETLEGEEFEHGKAWRARLSRHMDYRLIPMEEAGTSIAEALRLSMLLGLPEEIVMDAKRRLGGWKDEGEAKAGSG